MTWNEYNVAVGELFRDWHSSGWKEWIIFLQRDSKLWDELFPESSSFISLATKKGSNHTFNNNLYKFSNTEYKKVLI